MTTAHTRFPPRLAAALLAAVLSSAPAVGATAADDATWSPAASERLVKLPPGYLKKAVDQDYARSSLAAAVADAEETIGLKLRALEELRGAAERADGELRTELRHQFLAEKRAYLQLVARHQELRRQHAETRIRVYEGLLDRLRGEQGAMTPQKVALIEQQTAARNRFESSLGKVDAELFQSALASESRYARDYAKNVAGIERLVQAIDTHPMNAQAGAGGPLTREDFLRGLIADNEATLAVLDQEQSILGFMARLVALDALALSEAVDNGAALTAATAEPKDGLTDAVDFFVTR